MPGGFTINDLLKDNNIMNSESAELEVDRSNKIKLIYNIK